MAQLLLHDQRQEPARHARRDDAGGKRGNTITRWETLWLATAANKWFIAENDLGSIEPGNHADLAVLDRDFFTIPEADIPRIRSLLTIIGGQVKHDSGFFGRDLKDDGR